MTFLLRVIFTRLGLNRFYNHTGCGRILPLCEFLHNTHNPDVFIPLRWCLVKEKPQQLRQLVTNCSSRPDKCLAYRKLMRRTLR